MADSYQAYGANVPTLPNSNIITTNIPLDSYDPPKRGQLDVVKDGGAEIILREVIMRTPSPTPEEAEELLKTSMFDWKAMRNWRYWVRKEWRCRSYLSSVSAPLGALEESLFTDILRSGMIQGTILSVSSSLCSSSCSSFIIKTSSTGYNLLLIGCTSKFFQLESLLVLYFLLFLPRHTFLIAEPVLILCEPLLYETL